MFKDVYNEYNEGFVKIKAAKLGAERKIWFSADLHFGHTNILKFCPKTRPFVNVSEMNIKMVNDWNTLVHPDDIVYVLGDVRFTKERLERRLNGEKHLILGNHDQTIIASDWDSVQDYKQLCIEGKHVVLFHYPIHTWFRQQYGAIHLHGHTHGGQHNRPDTPNRLDVGYDATGKVVVSWDEVKNFSKGT